MKESEEIWKDIEGYEGIYEVSNFGRVRSLDRYYIATHSRAIGVPVRYLKKGTILKQTLNKCGYMYVTLKVNGKVTGKSVHRLVGKAFVPGYFEGADVNHIDENKLNNNADNLEWCTRRYNLMYNNRSKRVGIVQGKEVVQLSLDGEVVNTFPTAAHAARATGVAHTHICACCREHKKIKVVGGYRWKYKE